MIKKAPDEANLHVLPVAKGGWAIKTAGAPEPIKTFATKVEATAYAKKLTGKANAKSAGIGVGSVVTHETWIFASKAAKHGKISKIAPNAAKKGSPQFGSARGKFVIAADFDDTPEEFRDYVE